MPTMAASTGICLSPAGLAGGTALTEHHKFSLAGADGIDGHDGVLAIAEPGGVFFIDELRPQRAGACGPPWSRPSWSRRPDRSLQRGTFGASGFAYAVAYCLAAVFLAGASRGRMEAMPSSGRAMTWALTTSPILAGRGCAGVDSGFDGGDIAGDDGVAKAAADLAHGAGQFDVRRFEHCVDAGHETGQTFGF